ncbi:hypothetical protein AK812_SmicGene47572, partial [Symbiodinium microadriaticum]
GRLEDSDDRHPPAGGTERLRRAGCCAGARGEAGRGAGAGRLL